MSVTLPATTKDIQGDAPAQRAFFNASTQTSPLADSLSEIEAAWLMNHLRNRWGGLSNAMSSWRGDMEKWERQSEEDYTDRIHSKDEVNAASVKDIFELQNESLGVVSGFYDFHFAQAKDDIFGTRPWLAATPEGDDNELADVVSKHAQWKINQSNVEQTLIDALKVSTWGGTAFVKAAFRKEVESFEKLTNVAHWTDLAPQGMEPGKPVMAETGDYVKTQEELMAMGVSAEQVEWKLIPVEETAIVYNNVTNTLIDFRDIAFETTAPELNLLETDVFVKFKMGLLDVMKLCNIPLDRQGQLMGIIGAQVAKDFRDETEPGQDLATEEKVNPPVTLIEGFVRCAVKAGKAPIRIHTIFSPDLNVLFSLDALANVTPGGILPVFPVRINKKPGRIFGMGYFEKYETPGKAIDRQYNLITYRNRYNAHVYTAWNPDALADDGEGQNEQELDPTNPMKLKEGKTIADLIQFAVVPDTNGRAEMLLNSQMQMIQMRSGITSAAQGELKGVPSASTATGTRDLQSRGATLVKCPIDEQTSDIRNIVEFNVLLIYANQDRDEQFVWGDGREAKLMTIESAKVLDLKANVTLTLTRAQNQQKLQEAMTAIDIVAKYIAVPEMEKPAVRFAFVQALSNVGFNNANDVIRQATVDPEGILAVLPPELVPVVQQALVQAGIIPAAADPTATGEPPESAPVSAPVSAAP